MRIETDHAITIKRKESTERRHVGCRYEAKSDVGEDEQQPVPVLRRVVDKCDSTRSVALGRNTESRSRFPRKKALETLNIDGDSKHEVRMRHVSLSRKIPRKVVRETCFQQGRQ